MDELDERIARLRAKEREVAEERELLEQALASRPVTPLLLKPPTRPLTWEWVGSICIVCCVPVPTARLLRSLPFRWARAGCSSPAKRAISG